MTSSYFLTPHKAFKDGLQNFCASNKVIVNEIKTKSMCFGADDKFEIHFNGKPIEQVWQFKYLDTVDRSRKRRTQDVFSEKKPMYLYESSQSNIQHSEKGDIF